MRKLRLGFIGNWGHGSRVVNLFRKDTPEKVKLAGLAKVNAEEKFWELPSRYNSVPRYENYDKMLQEIDLDAVVVSTRLENINRAIIRSLNTGCSVLSEKPVAANFYELDDLNRALQSCGRELLLLLDNRAHPYLKAVKETVDSSAIGNPVIVNARKSYPWNRSRVDDFPLELGGTIGWVGIHALDFINAATGLTFNRVTGMESNQIDASLGRCPDNVGLVMELSNGAHATISLDYHRPQASPTHGDDWLRVVGDKGTIEANLSKNKVHCCTDQKADKEINIPAGDDYFREYFEFLLQGHYREKFSKMTQLSLHMTASCIIAQMGVNTEKIREVPEKYRVS